MNNSKSCVVQNHKIDLSFSFAAKEVKGATYFPFRAKDLEIWKKMLKKNGL